MFLTSRSVFLAPQSYVDAFFRAPWDNFLKTTMAEKSCDGALNVSETNSDQLPPSENTPTQSMFNVLWSGSSFIGAFRPHQQHASSERAKNTAATTQGNIVFATTTSNTTEQTQQTNLHLMGNNIKSTDFSLSYTNGTNSASISMASQNSRAACNLTSPPIFPPSQSRAASVAPEMLPRPPVQEVQVARMLPNPSPLTLSSNNTEKGASDGEQSGENLDFQQATEAVMTTLQAPNWCVELSKLLYWREIPSAQMSLCCHSMTAKTFTS